MPAAKKKPAKKTAPVAKKTPVRRSRPAKKNVPEVPPVPEKDLKDPNPREEVLDNKPENQEEMKEDGMSLIERVQQALVIDISHFSRLGRIIFMDFLETHGYKTNHLRNPTEDFNAGSEAEYLMLNHNNKIVTIIDHETMVGCPAISKVYLEAHVDLHVEPAEPYHPHTITQGNAVYLRVK